MTSVVFAQLLQQVLSGESLIERRHPGCLRPQLLGKVRTIAITRWYRERGTLLPDFQAWVAAGSRWPWGEDGQLALAYERLPAIAQCLLWHSIVERDDPALIARITGLAPHEVPAAYDQAKGALRQARTDLYLDRLERTDCRDAIRRLTQQPEAPPDEVLAAHLGACPACVSLYWDVTRLDRQLDAQLPVRLLGWWPGEQYLREKAAIPLPLGEPMFLAGLLKQVRADSPEGRPRVRRSKTTILGSLAKARAESSLLFRRSRAAVAVVGFLAGVAAGMLLLTACDEQRPQQPPPASGFAPAPDTTPSRRTPAPAALSARFPIEADEYTSLDDASVGSAPGTRVLGSTSVLLFERVDFSTSHDTLARVMLAGEPDSGAELELRLDGPDGPVLARISPSTYDPLEDISVPIIPIEGVHRVRVTATCPTTIDPCVELHSFGTAPSPPGDAA